MSTIWSKLKEQSTHSVMLQAFIVFLLAAIAKHVGVDLVSWAGEMKTTVEALAGLWVALHVGARLVLPDPSPAATTVVAAAATEGAKEGVQEALN